MRHKWIYLTAVLAYSLGAAKDILPPLVYKEIIDTISFSSPVDTPWSELAQPIMYLIGIFVFGFVMHRIGDYCLITFLVKFQKTLGKDIFKRIRKHSYQFFVNNFSGSLVAKFNRFHWAFDNMNDTIIFDFWITGVNLIGSLIFLTIYHPLTGMLFALWIVIFLAVIFWFISKKKKYDLLFAASDSKLTGTISDVITNILNVKIFARSKKETRAYEKAFNNFADDYGKKWYFSNYGFALKAFMIMSIEIVVIYFALKAWQAGSISAGTIVLIQSYLFANFVRLNDIGRAITNFASNAYNATEMVEILELTPEIEDPTKPQKCKIQAGKIEFSDITFAYDDKTKNILKKFNLTLQPGKKYGLVGASGAGKSTLTKLMLRFADVQSGSLQIDGQDVRDLRQDDLRAQISYVPQEPLLFHRSLRENIGYGDDKATEKQIIAAAKKAHAHTFIKNLDKGYDTLVGERGVKLSGGERQRVAIARAMLKKAPILVLDEATSSLDSVSERYIQDALDTLMKGKTTLVIAHRLSTIQKMDEIIVMDKGKIVEQGSHTDLLRKKGKYAELWSHQSHGFLDI